MFTYLQCLSVHLASFKCESAKVVGTFNQKKVLQEPPHCEFFAKIRCELYLVRHLRHGPRGKCYVAELLVLQQLFFYN